jgi:hypothetical protein
MENQPQIIAIGRKRFPIEDIALVEPFEPPAEQSPRFTSDKDFKARVVLIDRYNVLTEDTVEVFTEANKFRRLPDDNVATNPAVRFRVETFEPSEGFQPRKPYQSRLKWRDQDGNEQSKLLPTKPETVIAVVLRGEGHQDTPSEASAAFWAPSHAVMPYRRLVHLHDIVARPANSLRAHRRRLTRGGLARIICRSNHLGPPPQQEWRSAAPAPAASHSRTQQHRRRAVGARSGSPACPIASPEARRGPKPSRSGGRRR